MSLTPKRYVCSRATPDQRTGRCAAPAWELAPWSDPFVDIEGDAKPRPAYETRVKMLWDDKFLYVGAWLEEPHVWATLTQHDSVIFQDNDFEIFLDPDGDALRYFEFEVNALGTTWDLYLEKPYRDSGSADNGFEWNAEVAVWIDGTLNDPSDQDRGWGLEIALPWSAIADRAGMPCPPRPGDVWRINFSRVQWEVDIVDGKTIKRPNTPEMNWVWSPQGVIDMHQPEQWGYLEFADQP